MLPPLILLAHLYLYWFSGIKRLMGLWKNRQEEGGLHGDSMMKSNNSLRLMGECCCTRSKQNSISFSCVQAHIPGILSLARRCEALKLMWVMRRAGSGPGFSVISSSYLLLYEYYCSWGGGLNQSCEMGMSEGSKGGWNEYDCDRGETDRKQISSSTIIHSKSLQL